MRAILFSFASLAALAAAFPASAEQGDFLIRARGIGIFPSTDANVVPLGGTVDADDAYVPEVDFSYFLTDNLAVELIAATARHDVTWRATDGSGATIDLGSVRLLPPTLTLQYHFTQLGALKPYVGGGVNFTWFLDENDPAGLNIAYDNQFAPAVQFGVDYFVTERAFVNADVKKIFLETNADINSGFVTAGVDLNPWIVGFGVGFRF